MSKARDIVKGTATSLAGGVTGAVPYQSSTGITAMTAAGTTGQILTTLTTGAAPTWQIPSSSNVGFLNIPQNIQATAYTLVLGDSGYHIYHASGAAAATYTIPAATVVAFPIGTAISFINLATAAVTIAITTDTMYLGGAGTTGSRTLAQYGSATAIKVAGLSSSGIWIISGSGLT